LWGLVRFAATGLGRIESLALLWQINGLIALISDALRSFWSVIDGGLEDDAKGLAEAAC
jgi:hypothetical protein